MSAEEEREDDSAFDVNGSIMGGELVGGSFTFDFKIGVPSANGRARDAVGDLSVKSIALGDIGVVWRMLGDRMVLFGDGWM